ncbi:MAG: hypothetical protein PVF73_06090 [Bacteroidales bacterium]|jgi:hypothetical protein
MKRLLSCFFILVCIFLSSPAQEKPEKKVYISDENNRLYVNKDLGIYLWLSTSPDPNAEKVRLVSDSSDRYSNPMYFDTEGYNTVRSPWRVDTVTKKTVYPRGDIIFEVYADGIPPSSRSAYHSSVYKLIGGNKYYSPDLRIELRSHDAVSGVKSTSCSLNGNPYAIYDKALEKFKEGMNTLRFYSIDHVGNMEQEKEDIFYMDTRPPVTEFEIDNLGNEKYVSSKTTIKLISKDSLSGVKGIYYRINDGKQIKYYRPIPVSALGSEDGTITFFAEDYLGNREKEQVIGGKGTYQRPGESSEASDVTFEFYVDNDPPEVELSVENDLYKGKYNFVSARSKFNIEATDEKAGVGKTVYSINSYNIDIPYTQPFTIEKEGLKYLRLKAVDYVKNESPVQLHTYFCDTDPPNTNIVIGSPKFSSRDTLFISGKTEISFASSDNQSGLKSVSYSLNGTDFKEYSTPFTIEKPGLQTISYHASDNVNNKNDIKTRLVFLDNKPPVIHYHFSVESIGRKTVRDEVYTIYPTNTMLYIAATDASSGGEKILYKINDGNTRSDNPLRGLAPGNYHIEIEAFDVLGNKSAEIIKFAIEE